MPRGSEGGKRPSVREQTRSHMDEAAAIAHWLERPI
jgi:hypothetical protein